MPGRKIVVPISLSANSKVRRVAYFVSPHGFGHAARAAAVMQALREGGADVEFDIFSTLPPWFFQDSMSAPFVYHKLLTDIGLVQKTAFEADLIRTLRSLDHFLPFQQSLIDEIAAKIKKLNSCVIISDISPLGIAVAKAAGIPSVLVENFTWDWIYHQYVEADCRFKRHIDYLKALFEAADYHIKTEPNCGPGRADLKTLPISRSVKTPADRIRTQLNIPEAAKMVLITSGGIPQEYEFLNELKNRPDIHFILPGAGPNLKHYTNYAILPHRSRFYHPDLVNASDAVVGKVGYSTLSEVYHAGVPFGYVLRANFRESKPLARFIAREMVGIALKKSDFSTGKWISHLEDLLRLKRLTRETVNGSAQVGNFIRKHILQKHAKKNYFRWTNRS